MENLMAEIVMVNGVNMTVAEIVAELESTQTRLAQVLEVNESLELQVEELKSGKKSTNGSALHKNNEMCVELLELWSKVEPDMVVVRNKREYPLVTESEKHLMECFISTDCNIKKTGEVYGCSHTNVWQRLYGRDNESGLRAKLRKYFNETQVESAQVESEVEQVESGEVEIA